MRQAEGLFFRLLPRSRATRKLSVPSAFAIIDQRQSGLPVAVGERGKVAGVPSGG